MKKIILAIAATILLSAADAQDTIHTTTPLDDYFVPQWHHYQYGDSVYGTEVWYGGGLHYLANILSTDDTITIYGFAVGVTTKWPDTAYDYYNYNPETQQCDSVVQSGYYDHNGDWHLIGDSSLIESYMDFAIMQEMKDQVVEQVSDSVRLHLLYDTVSYYLDMGFFDLHYRNWLTPPDPSFPILSVYEKYFGHPVTVYDRFYLGGINHSELQYTNNLNTTYDMYPRIAIIGWGRPGDNEVPINIIHRNNTDEWIEGNVGGNYWQWFFPILTPNPDTTVYVPNDSTQTGDSTQTSIQRAAWEKYVSLQPNPATDVATVLSSFGMAAVEVFDMAGNRVLVHKAKGYEAKLDVAALPRGSYIVRINTPMGTTSRKLLLQ